MPRPHSVLRASGLFGLLGSATLAIACLLSALPYRGRIGETYSPLNHFVSELGEVGVNPGAVWFNAGLVVGGLCLTLFMAGIWALDRRRTTRAAAVAGVLSALSVIAVGLIPMNHLLPHLIVAGGFFLGGLLTITLFTASISASRRRPRGLLWVGLPALISYAVLLGSLPMSGIDLNDLPLDERRPGLWVPPLVEWVVVVATLGWIVVVSVFLSRPRPR